MRKVMALAIIISALLIHLNAFAYYDYEGDSVGQPDTSNWFEWNIPDDKAAMGSAIDASFILDAPAGKHGFINVDGEDFRFDDGTKVNFYGCNIAYGGLYLNKEDAEKLADRIARTGYNLARFHHLDFGLSDNIFGEGTTSTTQVLDPDRLDKLFYLMKCLKDRGVYWYVDCTTSRGNINADGTLISTDPALANVEWSLRTIRYDWGGVDEQLQINYLRNLFTTKNPYTGLSMAEDPAFVMTDVTNEVSPLYFDADNGNITRSILRSSWNNWLKDKYGTDEKLVEAWKEEGKNGLMDGESIITGTVDFQGDGSKDTFTYLAEGNFSAVRKEDYRSFLLYLADGFYERWYNILRNEIGLKCMITGVGMGGSQCPSSLVQPLTDHSDYIDKHGYKSHPVNYGWNPGGQLTSWTSQTIVGGGELWRFWGSTKEANVPFVMGEWNVCPPGPYAAEATVFTAIMSSLNNWNPIHFELYGSRQTEIDWEEPDVENFFDEFFQMDKTALTPAATVMFHRGDIGEFNNEYYVAYDHDDMISDELFSSGNHSMAHMFPYIKSGIIHTATEKNRSFENTPEGFERALEQYTNNEPQTDTVDFNRRSGILKVSTPYSNVATGYIGSKRIECEFSNIECKNYAGTITITSMTKDTLEESGKILLTTVTKSRNKGLTLDEETGLKLVTIGTSPQIMEPVVAEITIKTTDDIKVYALDESGQRKAEVPVEKLDNGYSFFIADGLNFKTPHYEIAR